MQSLDDRRGDADSPAGMDAPGRGVSVRFGLTWYVLGAIAERLRPTR
jgi:hypothetical protein